MMDGKLMTSLIFISSGSMSSALVASWQAIPSANDLIRTGSIPRSGSTAATDDRRHVWLFGGYAEAEGRPRDVVNDLLRYTAQGWELIEGHEKHAKNRPGPRLASAAAFCDHELLLFGGWDPQTPGTGGIILDDVWAFDVTNLRWSSCQPMPRGPTSRHVAANVGGTVVVHTFRCRESVLVWDRSSRSLVEQPTSGEPPSPRGLHVGVAADEHTLLVFGGASKDGKMCNDAFALDTRSWVWRRVAEDGDLRPSARAGACAAQLACGRGMVVCCGAEPSPSGLVPRADVWALILDDNYRGTWQQLLEDDAEGAPGPRNAAVLSHAEDKLLLHGGWWPFRSTYGDSYLLHVSEGQM